MTTSHPEPKPLALAAVAVAGVLASGMLGGATNAVNSRVSPTYYVTILYWQGVDDVWRAAVAQGVFEGLLFGVAFSLVFCVVTGIVTRAACPFGLAFVHLLGILAGALVCWLIGGLLAVGLASLSPEFYRRAFIGVPNEFGPMLRYAWVGGSIWGVEFGGFASLVIGLVVLRARWLRRVESART